VSPEDDAAGLAQSSNLQAESVQNKALVTNIINTLSYQRTQDGFLQQVQKAMERMGELVMLAHDESKSDLDRASYQKEFAELQEAIARIQEKTFNEASLFGWNTDGVMIAADGSKAYMEGIDLSLVLGKISHLDLSTISSMAATSSYEVTTLAGSGSAGSVDSVGTAASFYFPMSATVDRNTGIVYVGDNVNNRIRKITPDGVVTTFAGSGVAGSKDGNGTDATFSWPVGTAVDSSGNVYVADRDNHKIRKITQEGVVTTLAGSGSIGSADGVGAAASFNYPRSVAVDKLGNVFVSDTLNRKIRKITPEGVVSTLAGSGAIGSADGIGADASFKITLQIAVDNSGNVLVADVNNSKIRKVTQEGVVTTFAGTGVAGNADGTTATATFNQPTGIAVDSDGNVYVSDYSSNIIRKISSSGLVTTIAGSGTAGSADGYGVNASFNSVGYISVDSAGDVYAGGNFDKKIRKIITPKNDAMTAINDAVHKTASLRAQVGANIARMESEISTIQVYDENLQKAASQIADVDVAKESARYARNQILVKRGTAILVQANAMPARALKIFDHMFRNNWY